MDLHFVQGKNSDGFAALWGYRNIFRMKFRGVCIGGLEIAGTRDATGTEEFDVWMVSLLRRVKDTQRLDDLLSSIDLSRVTCARVGPTFQETSPVSELRLLDYCWVTYG